LWTPLYDAVGRGIDILDEALQGKLGKAVLAIMNDGADNASKEFTYDRIKTLIKGTAGCGLTDDLPRRAPELPSGACTAPRPAQTCWLGFEI
jgi:hypothetical protein